MPHGSRTFIGIFASALLWLSTAGATTVPSLSFEQLTDQSALVVAGQINRSWSDWDAEHKYIWTHYELAVASALKGSPASTVVVSEPGGVVGLHALTIAGAPVYGIGEQVLIFLQRMPNGYLRTTGWSQGKFELDKSGRLHSQTPPGGLELVDGKSRAVATSLRSLDGISLAQMRGLVAARLHGSAK